MTYMHSMMITNFQIFLSKFSRENLNQKKKHQGTHATLIDHDTSIEDYKFIHKLYCKRNKFRLPIVRMSHISSNISLSIFFDSFCSQLYRTGRCTLLFVGFIPLKFIVEWFLKEVLLTNYQGSLGNIFKKSLGFMQIWGWIVAT